MKKLFTVLTALLLLGAQSSFAQDCPVLNESAEQSFSTSAGGGNVEYELNGQGAELTFQAKKSSGLPDAASPKVEQYVNGSWSSVGSFSPSSSYIDYGPWNIDRNATKIRFSASGGLYKRYIRNVLVTRATYVDAPAESTLAFDTKKINSADDEKSTTILWGNTEALTLTLSGANVAQFTASITGNATTCTNGTATITVNYKHNVVGTHNATLTVSNGAYSYDIALSGTTEKKDQQIVWADGYTDDQITLPVGKEVLDAATALSGYAVTYSSSNEGVLAITNDGSAFKAVAAGSATLTVSQAGDDTEWNSVSVSKTVVVTEKKVQSILWTDDLSRLKIGGEDIALSAVVRILTIEDETETYVEDAERTALLTFASADNNVVSVNGNVLHIVGEGETTVTASVPGNDEYEATSLSMPVRVRAASSLCEAYVLDDAAERSIYTISSTTYTINGPADQLEFQARRSNSLSGDLLVDIYHDGIWETIFEEGVSTSYSLYGPFSLPRNTTQVKFYTKAGATMYKYIKDVTVTMARYLETSTPSVTVEKSIIGDVVRGEVKIQYSNMPEDLPISNVSSQVKWSDVSLGNLCDKYGEKTISFVVTPTALGEINDVLTIGDESTEYSLSIPVTIYTQRNTQTIAWEDELTDILTTDDITLTATAETEVSYSSSDETIAYVDADNRLVIVRDGVVTITAHAAQDDKFEAATLSKEVTISLATPVILSAPTIAEDIVYGAALSDDLLEGGAADVAGTFVWNVAAGTIYEPGEHSVPVLFIPEDGNRYRTAETSVLVTVLRAEQEIVWEDNLDGLTVNDVVYLNASAQTAVFYSVSNPEVAVVEGNMLRFLASGEVTIIAEAEESDLYNAARAERTIQVGRAGTQIISAPTVEGTLAYGQPLSALTLIGGEANCAGHFEWEEPDRNDQVVGGYMMNVVFIPEDEEYFDRALCSVYVEIVAAEQEIVWDFLYTIINVGDKITLDAIATSGYTVTYTLDPTDIAILNENNELTALAEGTLTITAYQEGIDEDGYQNYNAAEPVSFTITIATNSTRNVSPMEDGNQGLHVKKIVRDGQVYILRDGEMFNLQGQKIR